MVSEKEQTVGSDHEDVTGNQWFFSLIVSKLNLGNQLRINLISFIGPPGRRKCTETMTDSVESDSESESGWGH